MYKEVKCLLLNCLITIDILSRASYTQAEDTLEPKVRILQGTLQGFTLTTNHERNISAFLGIPYAQPPIGELRFANPVSADDWNGTLNATVDGSKCPQISGTTVEGDEDCLYLNVYTPQLPQNTSSSLLPVIVFIHGGRFAKGSSDSGKYGPEYLLDEDIVLVAPNYRIGPLGYLSTGDEVAPGNWALKDLVLALKWVQNNVAFFGGDPDQVTLFGYSAGSVNVHLLALADSTIGLFHKYITGSGSALAQWAHQPRSDCASRAFELGSYVDCSSDTSTSLINCLRMVNFSDILATYPKFLLWNSSPVMVWTPTDEPDIDGAILTDSPKNLFAAGKARDVPWMTGVVRDEGLLTTSEFYEDEEMFEDFLENFSFVLPLLLSITYQSDSGAAWTKAMKSYYFNDDLTTNRSVLLSNLTQLINDALFFYPAYNAVVNQLDQRESSTYFYTFDYRGTFSHSFLYGGSTTNYGVSHSDVLLYVFPPETSFAQNYGASVSETDLEMVDIMVQLKTSFAIDGIPKCRAFDGWEPYSTEGNYLKIGNESDVAVHVQYSFFKERMEFWAALESASATITPKSFFVIFIPFLIFVLSMFNQ